jgi:hypothetical protein
MWRIDSVAGDLIHRLASGTSMCLLKLRYETDAGRTYFAASGVWATFVQARTKFDQLALQQTEWQEGTGTSARDESGPTTQIVSKVEIEQLLSAAREVKQAFEAVREVITKADTLPECLHTESSGKARDLSYVTKLIDFMEHSLHSTGNIPSTNLWGVNAEALPGQTDILATVWACSPNAGEKKQARNIATEAINAYQRLTKAIVTFDALALQQTEWEEQAHHKSAVVREQ